MASTGIIIKNIDSTIQRTIVARFSYDKWTSLK